MIEILPVIKGALTYVPILYDPRRFDSTGIVAARYCYSVWLRHLVSLHRRGIDCDTTVVAELGPGPSLGVCIAAVLTGTERALALDLVDFARSAHNLQIATEILDLLMNRAAIPDDREFPGMYPKLDDYRFPNDMLSDARMRVALAKSRVRQIMRSLDPSNEPSDTDMVEYRAPWYTDDVVRVGSVGLVISQAVLEHVDELGSTYDAMGRWLAPAAFASHVIDFRSHSLTKGWDGHLQYSPRLWRIVRGRRPYLLNRASPGQHLHRASAAGLSAVACERQITTPSLARSRLAASFASWSDDDRCTSTMHLILENTKRGFSGATTESCASP